MKENKRIANEPIRPHEVDYQSNFPKMFSNFDRPTSKLPTGKTNQISGNQNNFPMKYQLQEPAPCTVIQTYAERLRYNQSKRGVSIK